MKIQLIITFLFFERKKYTIAKVLTTKLEMSDLEKLGLNNTSHNK